MIKPQNFIALAAVTALSVVSAAVLFAATNRWSVGKVEGARLVPGLDRQEKAIGAVEITQGEKRITLERLDSVWKLKERAGYPANPERVRALLTTLAAAQLVDPKTAAKDRWAQLELDDPAGKDAKSRGVRVLDTKGKPLAEIVLGKSRYDAFGSGKGGIYVRRQNEAQTWLATGEPKGSTDVKDWVAVTAFETEQAKIAKVTIEHPNEVAIVVEKGDGKDQKFKLVDKTPEGQKVKQSAVDQIGQGFASIELEDVRKLDATPAGDKVTVVRLESEGGLVVTFRLRKEGEANWLSFVATGPEADAKTKADQINAKAGGWEIKIPQWKADQIGKRRAELFEAAS